MKTKEQIVTQLFRNKYITNNEMAILLDKQNEERPKWLEELIPSKNKVYIKGLQYSLND